MHAAAVRLELRIKEARSLKAKRSVLKKVSSMLSSTFGVSVSEVDHQNLWQRATLGVALVAPQAGHLERVIHSVQRSLLAHDDVELIEMAVSYLEER
jgi:uncharacterized protein YlxP (DUF503 family)